MTPRLPPENARGPVALGRRDLAALAAVSTPRVCDTLEHLAPERRAAGHTTQPLDCAFPALPPVVGHARTALVTTLAPCAGGEAAERRRRLDWLDYVAAGPKPAIVVVQDIDGAAGLAASWGEVMAHMHRALGVVGVVTDGAVRDIPGMPDGIQFLHRGERPSHGWLHTVAMDCEVQVAGMLVAPGDIVHADRHGAVVVPADAVRDLPDTARRMAERDAPLLAAARAPGAGLDALKRVLLGLWESR